MDYNFLFSVSMAFIVFISGLIGFIKFAIPAMITGVIQARGRIYTRNDHTTRFYIGISFWIVLMLMGLVTTFVLINSMIQKGIN
jgi:hypothetical protein